MNHDEYHRKFADAIIEQIRKGTAPWQKPWAPGDRVLPMNVDTDWTGCPPARTPLPSRSGSPTRRPSGSWRTAECLSATSLATAPTTT